MFFSIVIVNQCHIDFGIIYFQLFINLSEISDSFYLSTHNTFKIESKREAEMLNLPKYELD